MCVLLFDVFKRLLLRTTDVLKICQKGKFLGKKIWNALALKSSKVQGIFEKMLIWHYYLQLCFVYKTVLRFLLNWFVREIKEFYQSSLRNEVDFRDIMNVSPNILAKNQNFKKLRLCSVDESVLITTALISPSHCKTLVLFCLRKKRPGNAFLTIIVNYRKIVQKNKWYSKQQKLSI